MLRHIRTLWIVLFLYGVLGATAQSGGTLVDFDKLFLQLEVEIQKGNKIALRDLGGFLDHPEYGDRARQLLVKLTIFNPDRIDVYQADREAFMAFFYNHFQEIYFSELLWAFTDGDFHPHLLKGIQLVETRSTEEQKQKDLRSYIATIETHLETDSDQVLDAIRKLSRLRLAHGSQYLIQFVTNRRLDALQIPKKATIYLELARGLTVLATAEALDALLELVEAQHIPKHEARTLLAQLTSIWVPREEDLVKAFRRYQVELVDIETMKQFTYDSLFQFRQAHFEHRVDYLGRVLSQVHRFPYLSESIRADLSQCEHPRALYYLSTLVLKTHRHPSLQIKLDPEEMTADLEAITGIRVEITPRRGKGYEKESDAERALRFMTYWHTHYTDFEWESGYRMFIDKIQVKLRLDNYDRAFRRLSSSNDSIAMASYRFLIEQNPKEVARLAQKYRPLLRNQNRKLPDIKAFYLEKLSKLAQYCKRNNHPYTPEGDLDQKLERLQNDLSQSERLQLENDLIQSVKLDDLTRLEFFSCLHSQNRAVSYSISRVLSYLYNKYWHRILKDDTQLMLYLKKAAAFTNLGESGLCETYLNRLMPIGSVLKERLLHIQRIEPDPDIQYQILELMGEGVEEEILTLAHVLSDPNYFQPFELRTLRALSRQDFEAIVQEIELLEDEGAIKKLFVLLRLHAHPEGVPVVIPLLEDCRIVGRAGERIIEVGDLVASFLNAAYPYSCKGPSNACMNRTDWRQYWEAHGEVIPEWEVRFFDAFVQSAIDQPEPDPTILSEIRESDFFESRHKLLLLHAIAKLDDAEALNKLQIYRLFHPSTDLPVFKKFAYTSKQLESLPHFFVLKEENECRYLAHFIMEKANTLPLMEQGALFNRLLNKHWFARVIFTGKGNPSWVEAIRKSLEHYYEYSEILSAYEEEQIDLNFFRLDLIGKSAVHQLMATAQLQDPVTVRKVVQSIVAQVSYEDLATIVKALSHTPMGDQPMTYQFVQKDFGLPVFDLHTPAERSIFIQDHQRMSEGDFYLHTLSQFGVGGLEKDGKLEVQRIYELLPMEMVPPFSGSRGGDRDWFSYGLIKLLELNYHTRLGFHEKLNENQSFYTFTNAKRMEAWIKYLEEKGEIRPIKRTDVVSPYTFSKEE